MSKVNLISKEKLIVKIKDEMTSVYSKEDVIKMIGLVAGDDTETDTDERVYSTKEVKALLEKVKDAVVNDIDYGNTSIEEICNLDDIELTLSGREIEIDTSNLGVDFSPITDSVECIIDEFIDDL